MKKTLSYLIIFALLAGCASRTPESAAEQYVNALLARDYFSFRTLFEKERQAYIREDAFNMLRLASCDVESASPTYVVIRYRLLREEDSTEETGVVYLLPDGKIKYDPIFVLHPALALRGLLSHLESDDVRFRQSAFYTLSIWELPLFGFTPDAAPEERINSVAQVRQWIHENEATFDLGQLKIPVSPVDLEMNQERSIRVAQ